MAHDQTQTFKQTKEELKMAMFYMLPLSFQSLRRYGLLATVTAPPTGDVPSSPGLRDTPGGRLGRSRGATGR